MAVVRPMILAPLVSMTAIFDRDGRRRLGRRVAGIIFIRIRAKPVIDGSAGTPGPTVPASVRMPFSDMTIFAGAKNKDAAFAVMFVRTIGTPGKCPESAPLPTRHGRQNRWSVKCFHTEFLASRSLGHPADRVGQLRAWSLQLLRAGARRGRIVETMVVQFTRKTPARMIAAPVKPRTTPADKTRDRRSILPSAVSAFAAKNGAPRLHTKRPGLAVPQAFSDARDVPCQHNGTHARQTRT